MPRTLIFHLYLSNCECACLNRTLIFVQASPICKGEYTVKLSYLWYPVYIPILVEFSVLFQCICGIRTFAYNTCFIVYFLLEALIFQSSNNLICCQVGFWAFSLSEVWWCTLVILAQEQEAVETQPSPAMSQDGARARGHWTHFLSAEGSLEPSAVHIFFVENANM